ncbi:tyrosine recombinase XerS [Brevibacillus reuszeri]|uniref:tyrosine recombinase XerS n=1 Tax=Brevibacillus reuszeri TaxID=54915 RepID=UPI003D260782
MVKKDIYNWELLDSKIYELPPFMIEHLEELRLNKASYHTLYNYTLDYHAFLDWIISESIQPGPKNVIPLSLFEYMRVDTAKGYQAHIQMKYAESSVTRMISSLKSLFRYLHEVAEDENQDPQLKRNVFAKLKLKKADESMDSKAQRIAGKILVKLDDDNNEMKEFLDFIYDGYLKLIDGNTRNVNYHMKNRERDRAIISLALATGLRAMELATLELEDLNMRNGIIDVLGKGNRKDTLPFGPLAKEHLQAYLDIRTDRYKVDKKVKSLFVSGSTRTGKAETFRKISIQKMVEKYAIAFGKPNLTVHKLRHSFGTRFHIENGADPVLTQRAMRHKNIQTTMIYTHVDNEKLKSAFRKANE